MRKNILASAALALLLATGAASAAVIVDQTEVVFTVDNACSFNVGESQINANAGAVNDGSGFVSYQSGANHVGMMSVVCSTGVPYTIQTDAAVGGNIALTGDTTGGSVPTFVYQGPQFSGVPFGSLANGEHYSGTANGQLQDVQYSVAINSLDGGNTSLPIPVADTYRRTIMWTFSH